jgi:hypothetical protein
LESTAIETRRAFGFLFVCVSIAVGAASILSELAFLNHAPFFFHAIIWLSSFAVVFGSMIPKFRSIFPAIKGRMKNSAKWSPSSKALNAVCWAAPFCAIPLLPNLYQYLILLGIGLGNLCTYFLIRKHSGNDNREQLIVASISLAALPAAFAIHSMIFFSQDAAVMLSRILIALSYAAGGLFAFFARK